MTSTSQQSPSDTTRRERHAATRTCVGCGARVDRARARDELVRLVLLRDGDGTVSAVVDLAGSATGRGAWVHARQPCLVGAARRGLSRAARARVAIDPSALARDIASAADRRLASLLAAARRSGHAAVGARAAEAALESGRLAVLVVARDARASARSTVALRALSSGRVLAWGDKETLGRALGAPRPVALVAILDGGFSEALLHAAALSDVTSGVKSDKGIH